MSFVRKPMHKQYLETALGKAWDERRTAFLNCQSSFNSDEDWQQFEIADLNWLRISDHNRLTGENPIIL